MRIRWSDAVLEGKDLENLIPLLRKLGRPLKTEGCRLSVERNGRQLKAIVFHKPLRASMLDVACQQAAAQVMVELFRHGFEARRAEGIMHWIVETNATLRQLKAIFGDLKRVGAMVILNRNGWAVEVRPGR